MENYKEKYGNKHQIQINGSPWGKGTQRALKDTDAPLFLTLGREFMGVSLLLFFIYLAHMCMQ